MEFPWTKKSRLKAEIELAEQKRSLLERQSKIGLSLTESIIQAARRNEVYNLYNDGTREKDISPIIVKTLPKNGDSFTILTTLPDKKCSSSTLGILGYAIHQIDINLLRVDKEIYLLAGWHGSESHWGIDRLDEFKKLITQKTEEFRLFRKQKAV